MLAYVCLHNASRRNLAENFNPTKVVQLSANLTANQGYHHGRCSRMLANGAHTKMQPNKVHCPNSLLSLPLEEPKRSVQRRTLKTNDIPLQLVTSRLGAKRLEASACFRIAEASPNKNILQFAMMKTILKLVNSIELSMRNLFTKHRFVNITL